MRSIERIIVILGVLDLAYVGWVVINTMAGPQFNAAWQSTVTFGLPLPALQSALVFATYLAILICGLSLLLRRTSLVWLNYLLFPLRVIFVLPTAFPLFIGLSAIGIKLHPGVIFALILASEVLRVFIVYRWSRVTVGRPAIVLPTA